MAHLQLIVVATLTFLHGIVISAPTKYDDDFTFVNLWNEIDVEIKDVVLRLKDSNDDYAQKVGHQCELLGQVIGNVIDQLHQETMDHEQGDIIFKRVMFVFRQIHVSLKLPENWNRSKLIYALESVSEHMQQLVFIAKTYCPQLRALLRTILINFLQFVRNLRLGDGILEKDVIIYESPRRMVSQIQEITRQFTDLLKDCEHMEVIRMVLRGYIRYVEEIIHKLEDKPIFGDEEIDAVTQRLADELRKMFVPLMKMILNETHVDVAAFKSNLIARFFAINEVFERLLNLIDTDICPPTPKDFLTKIIYFYYYTIKQTHFEIRTAYKNFFYSNGPKDADLNQLLTDSDKFEIESPEELVMSIQKLVQRFSANHWDAKPIAEYAREFVQVLEYVADKIAKEIRIQRLAYTEGIMMKFYEDLKTTKRTLEETAATKEEFVRSVQKIFVDLYKIVIVEKMQDNGYEHLLLKDVCIEFYNYLKNVFHQADIYNEIVGGKEDSDGNGRYQRQVVRRPKFVFIKVIKYE